MRIVICEDEHYWREALETSIRKWASARSIEIHCQSYSSPSELIARLKTQENFDVLFLDISLGEKMIDGISLAIYILLQRLFAVHNVDKRYLKAGKLNAGWHEANPLGVMQNAVSWLKRFFL